MPIDYTAYPADWKTRIRPDILKRANNRCENCGVENDIYICRHLKHPEQYIIWDSQNDHAYKVQEDGTTQQVRWDEVDGVYRTDKPVLVALTISHQDQDITHNDYSNLKALCQRCHLNHDRQNNNERKCERRRCEQGTSQPNLL